LINSLGWKILSVNSSTVSKREGLVGHTYLLVCVTLNLKAIVDCKKGYIPRVLGPFDQDYSNVQIKELSSTYC